MTPAELAYDSMLQGDGRTILYHPTTNYTSGSMASVYEMLRHPNTLIGLGDGGAHVGIMCDATDMAHALTHWTRDRERGARLPIEDIVRRLTLANAQAIGLRDRGELPPVARPISTSSTMSACSWADLRSSTTCRPVVSAWSNGRSASMPPSSLAYPCGVTESPLERCPDD